MLIHGCPLRNAVAASPRPSGTSSKTESVIWLSTSQADPVAATILNRSLSGCANAITVDVNCPFDCGLADELEELCLCLGADKTSLLAFSAASIAVDRSLATITARFSSARFLSSVYMMPSAKAPDAEFGCKMFLCAASQNPSWQDVPYCVPPMNKLVRDMAKPGFSWPIATRQRRENPGTSNMIRATALAPIRHFAKSVIHV